jgi:hypothetical protein
MARPPIIGGLTRGVSVRNPLENQRKSRSELEAEKYNIHKKERAAWRNERVMRRSRGQDPMSESDFHRAHDYVLGRTMTMQPGGELMQVVEVLRAIVDCSSAEDERMDYGKDYKVIDQDIDDEKMGTSLIMNRFEGQHILGIKRVKLI